MKLYDLLKEYGIPAKESKTRLNNNQIEVNGEKRKGDYELGHVSDVYDQGKFLMHLKRNTDFNKYKNQLMFFGLANVMGGESNIENEITEFLKDYKMVLISKERGIFIKISDKPVDKVNFHIEGKNSFEQEIELPEEKSDEEEIEKLKSDKAKVEKQLNNPGFVNNAPKFKVDQAKNRLKRIEDKLKELGVNEHVMNYNNFRNFNS
jgi:valyl-tRNA synthetase